ncbi:MAG: asparagine synthase (glutamine-hydrolyzing) [Myxococcales bacterium]|nr:asparagine synthase (glutamine-hydrolyzing) [Polyangiaceae bacterium]MDW8248453.1 asparagine synthase (glutamine-hydrolyzing) [Myxococcales bacterium]
MCGLVAILGMSRPVTRAPLERGIHSLRHRGPDGQAIWLDPQGLAGLAHARLSIIDLVGGWQPIANESGLIHGIVNGELYGFEAQRAELEARGHRFRTGSDSEVALHLYEEHGVRFVEHLRGEFAVILWDQQKRILVAARDRCGIKPLHYAIYDGRLFLASEIKALFAAGIPARWDTTRMAQLLGIGVLPDDLTMFHGVRQVPPGHVLLANTRQHHLLRYWDYDFATEEEMSGAEEEDCIRNFRTALEDAVRTRLRADVPVGCYLSGGVDSGAILGLASRFSGRPLRAFTLQFDHDAYDETSRAEEMARFAGADFCPLPMNSRSLAEHFSEATYHAETLCINAHGVAKFLLSRAVRDAGYRVVLTGEGADELLGGYAHFKQDVILHETSRYDPGKVEAMLQALVETNAVSRGLLLAEQRTPMEILRSLLGAVPSWFFSTTAYLVPLMPLLSAETRAQIEAVDEHLALVASVDIRGQLLGRDPLHQALYLWARSALPNYMLTILGDRMEMAGSVEGRVPFLDHLVIDAVRRVPAHLKIRGSTEKYLLREATRDVLAPTIYRREKHPFHAPPAVLQPDQALHRFVQDTLRSSALLELPFFDASRVIDFLDHLGEVPPAQAVLVEAMLMLLTSACVLQERFRPATSGWGGEASILGEFLIRA